LPKFRTDDVTDVSKVSFGILACCTAFVLAYGFLNIHTLFVKGNRRHNIALVMFYVFAQITLVRKYYCLSFQIVRFLLFLDPIFDYPPMVYLNLTSLPVYTYLILGYSHIANL